MRTWQKVAALAVAMVSVGGISAAVAQDGGGGNGPPPPVVRSGRALGGDVTEAKYVTITPCRIVDTRIEGSAIAAGSGRAFKIHGNGAVFAQQGGKAGGCGIPNQAVAIEATVTAVSAQGTGYLRVWPSGASEPTATFLNYIHGFNATNTGNVRIGCLAVCLVDDDLHVKTYQAATHVVIDVQGYSVRPMAAFVNGDGSLDRGSRVVQTNHLSGANYEVTFDQDVSSCSYSTSISNDSGVGYATVDARLGNADAVFVQTHNSAGAEIPMGFYLEVTC